MIMDADDLACQHEETPTTRMDLEASELQGERLCAESGPRVQIGGLGCLAGLQARLGVKWDLSGKTQKAPAKMTGANREAKWSAAPFS